jgi:hypothetical protein
METAMSTEPIPTWAMEAARPVALLYLGDEDMPEVELLACRIARCLVEQRSIGDRAGWLRGIEVGAFQIEKGPLAHDHYAIDAVEAMRATPYSGPTGDDGGGR